MEEKIYMVKKGKLIYPVQEYSKQGRCLYFRSVPQNCIHLWDLLKKLSYFNDVIIVLNDNKMCICFYAHNIPNIRLDISEQLHHLDINEKFLQILTGFEM